MTEAIVQEKRRLDYKSPDFTIEDIDLTFTLDMEATVVTAVSKVKRLTSDKQAALVLDGEELVLKEVLVNDCATEYEVTPSSLILKNVPNDFTLKIVTIINPKNNTSLMGLYVSDGKFCTQNEPEGFRRITYFLDRSDVLAKYTTHIQAPNNQYTYMLSNGNLISDVVENDIRTVTWQDPFPKPSYLFALVAGDFDELKREFITKSGKKVDVFLYVDKGQAKRGTIAIDSIIKAMKWDESRFNLEYDLNRFMVVAVDFFNAGAMENKGLNIFNSKYVLADAETATDTDIENVLSVIGHEYFHNWTGDRVTCRDWFQLSLKEGLTVFRDQEFSSDLGSRAIERIKAVKVIRGPQFAEDAGPMAHPIRPDFVMEMNNFYSVTVYDKGAEVIRMMHTMLGEELFQKGMKLYFERHDGKAVTCEDFVSALEDASNIDLTAFRNWYSQAGTPVVTMSMSYDADKKQCTLSIHQHTAATPRQEHKEPFVIPIKLSLYSKSGEKIALMRNNCELSNVQILKNSEESWVFENVPSEPIVSLLENFSAPVKLEYPYTEDELLSLLKYAEDEFVRFDAVQNLINNYVLVNVTNYQRQLPFSSLNTVIEAFKYILNDTKIDRRFKAFLLQVPSVNTLMELFKVVDIDAIIAIRKFILSSLSLELGLGFSKAYNSLLSEYKARLSVENSYECNDSQMGERALASITLLYTALYLQQTDEAKANELVLNHYQLADNMTDSIAAMNIACNLDLAAQEQILNDYEAKWQDNALVFDNYFRAVSGAPYQNTLSKVKKLMQHKCFDMGNPNRIRALIGNFAMNNPEVFHAIDGSGYEFLTEILMQLNASNPHVAARIMTPMISLNRFDPKRKALIEDCFMKLKSLDNLSVSIFELIDKSLK